MFYIKLCKRYEDIIMQMTPPDALMRVSRTMQWFCLLALAVIVVGATFGAVRSLVDPGTIAEFYAGAGLLAERITRTQVVLAMLVNAPNLVLIAYALIALWKLFGAFRAGDLVSRATATLMRRAGGAFVLAAVWGVIAHTLSLLVLTINNPEGQRQLSIVLSSDQFFPLLLAGVLFAIGHVLSIAAAIDDENRAFV